MVVREVAPNVTAANPVIVFAIGSASIISADNTFCVRTFCVSTTVPWIVAVDCAAAGVPANEIAKTTSAVPYPILRRIMKTSGSGHEVRPL